MSVMVNVTMKEEQEHVVRIIHSYRKSKDSPTIIFGIPKDIREQYNITEPTSLYLIPKEDYFILKKVDLDSVNI